MYNEYTHFIIYLLLNLSIPVLNLTILGIIKCIHKFFDDFAWNYHSNETSKS